MTDKEWKQEYFRTRENTDVKIPELYNPNEQQIRNILWELKTQTQLIKDLDKKLEEAINKMNLILSTPNREEAYPKEGRP